MKSWIWLKVAAALQALSAVLHTIATARETATRGPAEQAVFDAMQAFRFDIMGSTRSYWDFYRGYVFLMTVIFLLLAVLMWQLSNLSRKAPRQALPMVAAILVAQIFLDVVSWEYFFAGPGVMSLLIVLCLVTAVIGTYRSEPAMPAISRQVKAS